MMKNKKYLIAGASGLLGSELTKYLVGKNNNIIAADINTDILKSKLLEENIPSDSIDFIDFDITNEDAVIDLFSQDLQIDGAVNCTYPRNKNYGKHFFDVNLDSFNENVSLHLGSAFLFSQQAAAMFLKNKRNFSLVNISSIYGVVAPKFSIYEGTDMTMPVEYAAIKSGIVHLNKYIASYISDSRFRVNSISPGGLFDNQNESFCNAYRRHTHGKGMLNIQDVLGTIYFLLNDDSKYITGQNIIIDDGFSLC
ncbi:flagellin modification protein A [Pectobacterium carotovorum subsp. carotovorum]|uniref:oxidoreductase n=2 Tax=Pectobacterium TaxID=122277 RepID=UPI0005827B7E|nr:oxidoreductase [Pectobacterium polaris]KHS85089.1 flagellin modification protein A [Pectobacterium carotovorum subsp. carotovorum]MDE8742021.1 oxidoreductase [Pectobacterium polaris]